MKVFLSIHGISRSRVRRIQKAIITTNRSPKDKRGKHKNHYKATPQPIIELIHHHIKSLSPPTTPIKTSPISNPFEIMCIDKAIREQLKEIVFRS